MKKKAEAGVSRDLSLVTKFSFFILLFHKGGSDIAIHYLSRYGGLIFVLSFINGCAVTPERAAWPPELPPLAYFESRYAEDPGNSQHQSRQEYLKWVKAFYRGWGGLRGWNAIREELLADADAADRESMRRQLDVLGRRISGEWAKAYGQRVINSKMLQVWVDAANEAAERREYARLLNRLTGDVDALLSGRLDPSMITLDR